MGRTQVYLDPAPKRWLSQNSHRHRVTISKLVRQAVEHFLGKIPSGFEEALENSFGLWGKRRDAGPIPFGLLCPTGWVLLPELLGNHAYFRARMHC